MDSPEFSEWIAYARNYYLPQERVELLLATLCSFFYNAHKRKTDPAKKPIEFMPWIEKEKITDPLDIMARLKAMTMAGKSRIKKRSEKIGTDRDGSR